MLAARINLTLDKVLMKKLYLVLYPARFLLPRFASGPASSGAVSGKHESNIFRVKHQASFRTTAFRATTLGIRVQFLSRADCHFAIVIDTRQVPPSSVLQVLLLDLTGKRNAGETRRGQPSNRSNYPDELTTPDNNQHFGQPA